MLKKLLLSVIPMLLLATMAMAEDDLLNEVSGLQATAIQDASIAIEDASLDGLDVDGLAANANSGQSDQAIEACFRRFGYGGGYNYGCYNNYHYGYGCYNTCYTTYYQPIYCYRPVTYHVCYPVCHHYWGCY